MVIRVVPANEASFEDIQAVFGECGDQSWCQCQWFKIPNAEWKQHSTEERRERLREQSHCGDVSAPATTGLVAYVDDEPAGWCAVEPRSRYARLPRTRIAAKGRDEEWADSSVWSVTCFVTRAGFRRLGVSGELVRATVEHARRHGARALEGYPIDTAVRGAKVRSTDLFVGSLAAFAAAGFAEVSRPTPDRVVMRIEL